MSTDTVEYVTVSTLKNMLELQDKAYKSALKMFVEELKVEVKEIRKEVDELKLSVNFMNANYEEMKTKHAKVETEITAVYRQREGLSQNLNEGLEALESKNEYLENHSRRDNIKIIGLEEKADEKTWDDTKQVVKKAIKEQLGIERDIFIERAHGVGKKLDGHAPNHRHVDSASRPTRSHANQSQHRPIVARFRFWKEKENVIREARRKRPKGVQFLNDFARRTLDRRAEKIPEMPEHRRNGKTAFMIMDKLVAYDRPPDRSNSRKRSKAKAYASFGFEERNDDQHVHVSGTSKSDFT